MKKKNLGVAHKPVLIQEVIKALRADEIARLHSNAQFIDATLGFGGHACEFVSRGIFVLGIDADAQAVRSAEEKLNKACPTPQKAGGCYKIIRGNYRDLDRYARRLKLDNVYGVLFDLGISGPQITSPERGFSFQYPDAVLDMRMNPEEQSVMAADLLNSLPDKHLFELFEPYLQYSEAKALSKKIVELRSRHKFEKVGDLLEAIKSVKINHENINKATLPFMALRIAVNTELVDLKEALPKAFEIINPSGRLAVISFHSGEDRIVKDFFRQKVEQQLARYPTEKIIVASQEEVANNPRARSAKLRVIQKNEKKEKTKKSP